MKTLIIYFSQTGNIRKIAECIHDGIIDAKSECNMKALNDVEPTSLSDYELMGIGSPVFWYKEPFNVQDFIEALPEQDGRHWFVFCTHGNIIGDFIPEPGPVSSQEWIEESKVLTKEAIKQFMPEFSINTDTCIQCHECEENCPVQGIDIGAEPPRRTRNFYKLY